MNDKELYDLFHAYRPELDDDDALLARLAEQMDVADKQRRLYFSFRKIAAIFLGVLLTSGIAFAAFFATFLLWPSDEPETRGMQSLTVEDMRPAFPAKERMVKGGSSSYFSDSYDEIVAEIERSGQQLEKAIAQV